MTILLALARDPYLAVLLAPRRAGPSAAVRRDRMASQHLKSTILSLSGVEEELVFLAELPQQKGSSIIIPDISSPDRRRSSARYETM